MRTALVALAGTVATIVSVAAVLPLGFLLLFGSYAGSLLLCVEALAVLRHSVYLIDTEASGQNGHLDLLA